MFDAKQPHLVFVNITSKVNLKKPWFVLLMLFVKHRIFFLSFKINMKSAKKKKNGKAILISRNHFMENVVDYFLV